MKSIGHRIHSRRKRPNKTNEEHLGNIDEEAIKISGPATEPDKKIAHGQDTQLTLKGHSRYFRLIVVSLSYLMVRTSRVHAQYYYLTYHHETSAVDSEGTGFISTAERAKAWRQGNM